jgi:hypothetical protein
LYVGQVIIAFDSEIETLIRNNTMAHFTFYADLVGISSLYAASSEQAYKKLNEYYNEVFFGLTAFYEGKPDVQVEMFSDSMVVRGGLDACDFMKIISPVYVNLLSKGLLLRGAVVEGNLKYDARLTAENFQKQLPDSDVLARCVCLEKKVKGARLVIEKKIAEPFFANHQDWLTLHGYSANRRTGDALAVMQRSIIPLPDGEAYELLYPVVANTDILSINKRIEELDYIMSALPHEVSVHHAETKRILVHSKIRLNDQNGCIQ